MLVFIDWDIESGSYIFKLVWLYLEYYIELPHYRKDVKILENAQKQFPRMLPKLEGINYK